MMQMQVVANYPHLLDKRFTVLDEHLSGDAIKDYPNLANIPAFTWKNAVYNGHLYGIPIPRGRVGGFDVIRPDVFAKRKVDTDITGGWDDFLESMKPLTSAKDRQWAFARGGSALGVMTRMNECANGWLEEGGNLTSVYETEQYKQAVQDTTALWKPGSCIPIRSAPSSRGSSCSAPGTSWSTPIDTWPGPPSSPPTRTTRASSRV